MTADKRVECGCHELCIGPDCGCAKPCRWPACLTDAEHAELAAELERDGL